MYKALDKLPRFWVDIKEDPVKREARLRSLAAAQVEVSLIYANSEEFKGTAVEMLATLISSAWWESRIASHIQRGECGKDECDHGTSISVYQVKSRKGGGVVPDKLWGAIYANESSSSDLLSTHAAAIVISAAHKAFYYRQGWRGVFSAYLVGKCKGAPQGASRARWRVKLERKLRGMK